MTPQQPGRLGRFLARPLGERQRILTSYLKNVRWRIAQFWKSNIPAIKHMEPGFLFMVWNDVTREAVLRGEFEKTERKFVETFLQPGMTVLDVGSYFGIYALTASVRVANTGRVIAFEPSPPQRNKLRWHLRLNACRNVRVEDIALSCSEGEGELFVPSKGSEGFSSLRSPDVATPVRSVRVRLMRLDTYLRRKRIGVVDFIKVDIEGGELDFFKGAIELLSKAPRPVILCELEDIRTKPWGYEAKDVEAYLQNLGYRWYRPLADGSLEPLRRTEDLHERNFVAVPTERMDSIREIIANGTCSKAESTRRG